MKKFFTLIAMVLVAVGANAATRTWTFSDDIWAKKGTVDGSNIVFNSVVDVEGLKVNAGEGVDKDGKANETFVIDANNKTIDGVKYTKRIKFGGSTNTNGTRSLSIDVKGNCTLKIGFAHASSSGDARKMLITTAPGNDPDAETVLKAFSIDASKYRAETFTYEGGATTLYICAAGGINLYFITAEGEGIDEYEEPDPEQQTAANSWDFTVIGDADAAAMKADADWTKTLKDDGETVSDYKYSKALTAAAATAGGTELNVTKGLKFTVKADQLIFNPGTRLNMGGNDRNVIIPELVKNDYVIVEYKINSADDNGRGFALPSNCELVEGALTSTTTDVATFKIKVKKGGSVTLTSIGGIGLRKIALNQAIPTGIQSVKTMKAANDGAIYNLAGQKVSNSFKGIAIQNGKKMILK